MLLLLLATDHLAAEDKHQHQEENADDEDEDAYAFGQPDVPGGGHVLVGSRVLAVPPAELAAAVAVVGAVRVLAERPVPARAPRTLVNVALTPAERAKDEERPSPCESDRGKPRTLRDQRLI